MSYNLFDDGERTKNNRKAKGSMAIDVEVVHLKTKNIVLAFDLKTGNSGTSKKKLPGYSKRLNRSPIIDIFIQRKK